MKLKEKEYMQELLHLDWFQTRPEQVRKAILQYPPYWIYKQKQTDYKCRLYSYVENKDGSCTKCSIMILLEDNPVPDMRFKYPLVENRRVFGVKLKDLSRYALMELTEYNNSYI